MVRVAVLSPLAFGLTTTAVVAKTVTGDRRANRLVGTLIRSDGGDTVTNCERQVG